MEAGYQMCYRARKHAKKIAQGTFDGQYNMLERYAHELKKRNSRSSVWIHTELEGEKAKFKRIYVCIEALKSGWKKGCRPYIGADGCHLKGVHKGIMLSAVGIDGNNGIYRVASAIVEGLENKQKLWVVARSCTINQFNANMEDMKKSTLLGWKWCMDRPAKHLSKSYFDPKFKCDILLNNHNESFNKSILPARKKGILGCLEQIRDDTTVRMANCRKSGPNWRSKVGPRNEKLLQKSAKKVMITDLSKSVSMSLRFKG